MPNSMLLVLIALVGIMSSMLGACVGLIFGLGAGCRYRQEEEVERTIYGRR